MQLNVLMNICSQESKIALQCGSFKRLLMLQQRRHGREAVAHLQQVAAALLQLGLVNAGPRSIDPETVNVVQVKEHIQALLHNDSRCQERLVLQPSPALLVIWLRSRLLWCDGGGQCKSPALALGSPNESHSNCCICRRRDGHAENLSLCLGQLRPGRDATVATPGSSSRRHQPMPRKPRK